MNSSAFNSSNVISLMLMQIPHRHEKLSSLGRTVAAAVRIHHGDHHRSRRSSARPRRGSVAFRRIQPQELERSSGQTPFENRAAQAD
jgi:hypothetical protein